MNDYVIVRYKDITSQNLESGCESFPLAVVEEIGRLLCVKGDVLFLARDLYDDGSCKATGIPLECVLNVVKLKKVKEVVDLF